MNEEYIKDICIIVQGPIIEIETIINTYKSFKKNVIISTNVITDEDYKLLINNNFNIIKNSLATIPGRLNFNNQVLNTFEGIKRGKELGFKYVFKIRSDIFIDDLNRFISLIDIEKIYFSAYHNYDGGYLCEHMLFGPIDFMFKLWDFPPSISDLPPEVQLTLKFYEINNNYTIDFLFPLLYSNNIRAYWSKYKFYLNDYENDKLFTYERK